MLEVKKAVGESRQNGICSERFSSHVSWEQKLQGAKATVRPMLNCRASWIAVSASSNVLGGEIISVFDN
jgi:hypothetical protein